jgi:hypothetical protein
MRKTILTIVCSCIILFAQAQFYKSVLPSPDFNDSLTRAVIDFRNDFRKIQGNELTPQVGMEVYQSKISLPGATHCAIYRYHSKLDTTACWQAIMYHGNNYEEAVKVYKNTCRLVNKSRIKWIDRSIASFIGSMEKPDENVPFANTMLQLNVSDPRYKNFYAEIEMASGSDGWEVHLNLQAKKDDATEN